ncbi:hypothetical protein TcasGA2_TC034164 [Tribolium castaneum]|uniref:Uncharacterized protein n=1 Tax=Tribolium castaneum TaxID=7070 RepID=A0A139WCV6_TRICA|nr:hypothetical protein TcasGA2_TC034164 [Tribolium castaneum]
MNITCDSTTRYWPSYLKILTILLPICVFKNIFFFWQTSCDLVNVAIEECHRRN